MDKAYEFEAEIKKAPDMDAAYVESRCKQEFGGARTCRAFDGEP